ncbi:MAG TPA: hypothetical protein VHC22_27250 [Pirellulales bacterium]|nr:hypothetical protein [Pirellulales bacterium]
MNLADISKKLIEIHRSVQRDSGYEDAGTVKESTCPLKDLKGFDSMLIPPMIRRLAKELGCPLKKGDRVLNIYVDGRRKLAISEIAKKFRDRFVKTVKEVAKV